MKNKNDLSGRSEAIQFIPIHTNHFHLTRHGMCKRQICRSGYTREYDAIIFTYWSVKKVHNLQKENYSSCVYYRFGIDSDNEILERVAYCLMRNFQSLTSIANGVGKAIKPKGDVNCKGNNVIGFRTFISRGP